MLNGIFSTIIRLVFWISVARYGFPKVFLWTLDRAIEAQKNAFSLDRRMNAALFKGRVHLLKKTDQNATQKEGTL